MEIHPNNDITNLDNEETSTALANANEKEAESEGNESYNSVEKVYFCTMCDEKFSKEKYLEAHVYMRHVVDKIFTCPYCDRTFDDKGNLKLHEKTHKDIRAFSCSAFNKQFKSKIYLKSHEKLHNGKKPFATEAFTSFTFHASFDVYSVFVCNKCSQCLPLLCIHSVCRLCAQTSIRRCLPTQPMLFSPYIFTLGESQLL